MADISEIDGSRYVAIERRRNVPADPEGWPPKDYHTQIAFNARTRRRVENPVTPPRLLVFYHVALMPGWRPIVREQIAFLRFVGLTDVRACFLGSLPDVFEAVREAEKLGVTLRPEFHSDDFGRYENPTLVALHSAATEDREAAFLYFHTKGASAPKDPLRTKWRRVMQRFVLGEWRENLARLATYDIVGANWQHNLQTPHYQGNFWMARGDWILSLEPPKDYLDNHHDIWFANQGWNRMHAELWLGSKPYHHMFSHVGDNFGWWLGLDRMAGVSEVIEGFSYEGFGGVE